MRAIARYAVAAAAYCYVLAILGVYVKGVVGAFAVIFSHI